jgi:glycosyltransferase 2 family protein
MPESPGTAPTPASARRGSWRPWLGLAISAVALGGCLVWALDQPAPQIPTTPRALGLLAAGLGVYATSMLLRGLRWTVILHRAGIQVAPAEPYALILVGYMGNTVLPLRGGEALRIVLLNERSGCGWKAAVGAIIPERLLDVAALVVLLGAIVVSGTLVTPGLEMVALIGVALLLLGGTGIVLYRWQRRLGRLAGFADRVRPFANASRLLMTPAGLWLGVMTLVIWTLDGTVFWVTAQALELSITLPEGVGLAVIATAFSTIPSGPAYAGTLDASLLVALRALGVTGSKALSYVLMVRFLIFVPVTIVGLLVAVTRYGGLGRLRRRTALAHELEREGPAGLDDAD